MHWYLLVMVAMGSAAVVALAMLLGKTKRLNKHHRIALMVAVTFIGGLGLKEYVYPEIREYLADRACDEGDATACEMLEAEQ